MCCKGEKQQGGYMDNLNSLIIEGNVVRDPVVRETQKGNLVCNFSIGSNRSYRSANGFEHEVSFFDVEAWGKTAEAVRDNCTKGTGVRVVGKIKQNRWEGSDGKKRSHVVVVSEYVEFKKPFKNIEETTEETAAEKEAELAF